MTRLLAFASALVRGRGIGPRLMRRVGGTAVAGVIALVAIISWQASRTAEAEAIASLTASARGYASDVGGEFGAVIAGTRNVAASFGVHVTAKTPLSRAVGDSLIQAALLAQPDQFGAWVLFEANRFDGLDTKYAGQAYHGPNGWFGPYWTRAGGSPTRTDLYDGGVDPTAGDFYQKPKETKQAYLSDPYEYPINGKATLMITASVPVLRDGTVVGVAGSDLTLSDIQARVAQIHPYDDAHASLIAPNGVYAATDDTARIGKLAVAKDSVDAFTKAIASSAVSVSVDGADRIVVRVPVTTRGTDRAWALDITVPRSTVLAPVRKLQAFAIVLGLITVTLVGVMIGANVTSIAAPLGRLAEAAERVAAGDLQVQVQHDHDDEVGRVTQAVQRVIASQQQLADASARLAAGDADVIISVRSDADVLGQAMTSLRDTVRSLVDETGTLITAARDGNLAARGDASRFEGAYASLVQGINDTLDAVTQPVVVATSALERLAQRDLTARVTGQWRGDHARIQSAVNAAADALATALREVRSASDRVSVAAQQIASGSDALAVGASEQAASLEEVSASLQESAGITQRNASDAGEASRTADDARKAAVEGTAAMTRLSDAVNRIRESSAATAKIVRTIDEIAFQTNLLALNAAVEAARAGDAGRGFAVVAEEVRGLALRSAEAARQTSALIEDSVTATESGVAITGEVADGLDRIATQVSSIDVMIRQIAEASADQAEGSRQVATALEQMNAVTQQSAANSEEAAAAAQELASEADRLRSLVEEFVLDEAKGARGTHAAPPSLATPSATARKKTRAYAAR